MQQRPALPDSVSKDLPAVVEARSRIEARYSLDGLQLTSALAPFALGAVCWTRGIRRPPLLLVGRVFGSCFAVGIAASPISWVAARTLKADEVLESMAILEKNLGGPRRDFLSGSGALIGGIVAPIVGYNALPAMSTMGKALRSCTLYAVCGILVGHSVGTWSAELWSSVAGRTADASPGPEEVIGSTTQRDRLD